MASRIASCAEVPGRSYSDVSGLLTFLHFDRYVCRRDKRMWGSACPRAEEGRWYQID